MKVYTEQESKQIQNVSRQLMSYFIINRRTGISYEIFYPCALTSCALAHSSLATEGHVRIDIPRLIKGLAKGKYRLTPKTLNVS